MGRLRACQTESRDQKQKSAIAETMVPTVTRQDADGAPVVVEATPVAKDESAEVIPFESS